MDQDELEAELASFVGQEQLSPMEQAVLGQFVRRLVEAGHADGDGAALTTLRSRLVVGDRAETLQRDPPTEPMGPRVRRAVGGPVLPPRLPADYQYQGPLGAGGMAEVHKVLDRRLGRVVAMKILHPALMSTESHRERFAEEARLTASLQHPGIVPVHEVGRLPDGRLFFTMKVVSGQTLREGILALHGGGGPPPPDGEWSLSHILGVFRRACEAVAYAHSRRVIHRDLKPSNIMVGAFGEVLVLDWGLGQMAGTGATATGPTTPQAQAPGPEEAEITVTTPGTPAYLAPEVVGTDGAHAGPELDVYALGAILYEILTGRPPYLGEDPVDVLRQVRKAPPPDVAELVAGRNVPAALVRLCQLALTRDPQARPRDASFLAQEMAAWLEGARKREEARRVVGEAAEILPRMESLREQALALREAARAELSRIPPGEPVARKRAAWEWEERAASLEREADILELTYVDTLQTALHLDPDLPEAHERLADFHHARHLAAERSRDATSALREEWLLRVHDRAGRHADYLRGDGALTLLTDPPGADVLLYRFEQRERRLFPRLIRSLGRTPLLEVTLPMGSYLLEIWSPGCTVVRLPVHIGRMIHWLLLRPGETSPAVIPLLSADDMGPDDVYIPAGWYASLPDPAAVSALPNRRVWVDGFVMRRFVVTNQDYMDFLEALVEEGREEEALRFAPQERGGSFGELGAQIYGRSPEGGFVLRRDVDGDLWRPDGPVVMVDWHGARAYARWLADAMGKPWRLPWEVEWEKAGRGADGRYYPWGDYFDPTWACVMDSRVGITGPDVVDSFPVDESPYGIRGMAGNVREWCEDVASAAGPQLVEGQVYEPDPGALASRSPLRVCRGGAWSTHARSARMASRTLHPTRERAGTIGFRIVRGV